MDEEFKDLNDNPDNDESTDSAESKSTISADLIRGHINTIILRALYERDKYGYEIIEEIEKKSHGQYSLKQPTLYSALKRLESQGYINAYWKTDEVSAGGRRKYYTLTDSGREITEKNQAEWEYSRTVIDNLISDRSFDFSQPAPTPVDFKILKQSTSRVPVVKLEKVEDDESEEDDDSVYSFNESQEQPQSAEPENTESEEKSPEVEVKPENVVFSDQVVYYDPSPDPTPTTPNSVYSAPKDTPVEEPSLNSQVQEAAPSFSKPVEEDTPMDEEQRKIVHQNYLKLISEPVSKPATPDIMPVADKIDTDKLIYNNKPETERDYRNLINNLFDKTIIQKQQPQVYPKEIIHESAQPSAPAAPAVRPDDINAKAANDGLKVNSAEFVMAKRKKSYSRGGSLFKSSLIVAIILLLEFALCLLFRNELGVVIAYPFVILAFAAAQLLIFGVLYFTDLGQTTRKPTSTAYLSACIIITIIIILIIFLISILLHVNFASVGDIMAKIIIPCLVALNIPIFAICFYIFSKKI